MTLSDDDLDAGGDPHEDESGAVRFTVAWNTPDGASPDGRALRLYEVTMRDVSHRWEVVRSARPADGGTEG